MSREQWWLDYIEGEVDEATHQQMRDLLRRSPADQSLVKSLADLKLLLQEHDEPPRPPSASRLRSLHDRIMTEVESLPPLRSALKLDQPRHKGLRLSGFPKLMVTKSSDQ